MSILTTEQQFALEAMLSGQNVFLTGGAGTGKSTIINEYKKTNSNAVYLAPTGCAASIVGGATIHSFFQLPIGAITPTNIGQLSDQKKRLIENVDTIIIDEISMVRSDVFWAITHRLNSLANSHSQHLPFGGKQLIVVGDFYQLPPVVATVVEDDYLTYNLGGIYAFSTPSWNNADFLKINLRQVHRQGSDNVFTSILNSIRVGDICSKLIKVNDVSPTADSLTAINHLTSNPFNPPEGSIAICATNLQVDEINYKHHRNIAGQSFYFNSIVQGTYPETDYPTSSSLELKVGSKVVLLNNLRKSAFEYCYTNGTFATVVGIDIIKSSVTVALPNGSNAVINTHSWDKLDYTIEIDQLTQELTIEQEIVGKFTQLPIKLAYAMTIHKAQGMSLNNVHVCLGGRLQLGQLYTALSRCSSLNKLTLDREINFNDVMVSPEVMNFYNQ